MVLPQIEAADDMESVGICIFDRNIRIDYDDRDLGSYILACYSVFVSHEFDSDFDGHIVITRCPDRSGWSLRNGTVVVECEYHSDIVYSLEKAITIILQELRSDLYFIHGAAIRHGSNCTLIVGASGAGKSTLCLDLCSLNYEYMSDELAPVDLDHMRVLPYPHALCLKSRPGTEQSGKYVSTEHTFHLPAEGLPTANPDKPATLQNIVFLDKSPPASAGLAVVSSAEAAGRLYSNGLNQLAHERLGLAAATAITKACRCFKMIRSDRRSNAKIVSRIIDGII